MTIKLLYFGATGYLGGEILNNILSNSSDLSITLLTRKPVEINGRGHSINYITGDINDYNVVKSLSSQHDVVVNAANGNLLNLVKGVLDGLSESLNLRPIYIQTSGAAVVMDDARGMHSTDRVYSDEDSATLNNLPASQPRRQIDPLIASYGDHINTHIVLPTTVYGSPTNTWANQHSIQIPQIVNASIARKQAGVIGLGANSWGNVHVSDVAALYTLILYRAIEGTLQSNSKGSYFFVNADEHTLMDVSATIAESLQNRSIGDGITSSFVEQEMQEYFSGSYFNGTNVRTFSKRARALGWKPKYVRKDMLKSIE